VGGREWAGPVHSRGRRKGSLPTPTESPFAQERLASLDAQQATADSATLTAVDLAQLFTEAQQVFEGRFKLERVVAGSPVRVLFVAGDAVLKRRVALRLHLVPGGRHRHWFEAETELLAALDHPSIRSVYSAGYEGEWAYRVSQWIEGESLADAVVRGPRSIPYVLRLARDLFSALEYAHSKQIVLRRIIPTTVMMDRAQRTVITDLRYANRCLKLAEPDTDESAVSFVAPEAWHGHFGEAASDIYNAGALLYFAITGEAPASNPKAIRPPSELRPETPMILDRMLQRALAHDPRNRYFSAAEMAEHLASVMGEVETPVGVPPAKTAKEDPGAWELQLRRALGDQYELLEELGVGGFGSVYRVRDLSLERDVALKVLHPFLTADLEIVERFRTEARLAAKLDHPNIVSIFGIGSRAGLVWYTMEYIPGMSLGRLLEIEGPMPLDRWIIMMRQASSALEHAHAQGLVHRDLKPANILIDNRDGAVQITDFGLALALHGQQSGTRLSHSGTPEYAAPEQMLGEAVDHRADIYALSVVGFHALTGRTPFLAESPQAVLAQKAAGGLPDVTGVRGGVPQEIVGVLTRGAARNPADRFTSARDFATALRHATGGGGLRRRIRQLFGSP
jgi:serine/threonine protein kinase